MNGLRQNGLAIEMYRGDNNGRTPNACPPFGNYWAEFLNPYAGSNFVRNVNKQACPEIFRPSNPTAAQYVMTGNYYRVFRDLCG